MLPGSRRRLPTRQSFTLLLLPPPWQPPAPTTTTCRAPTKSSAQAGAQATHGNNTVNLTPLVSVDGARDSSDACCWQGNAALPMSPTHNLDHPPHPPPPTRPQPPAQRGSGSRQRKASGRRQRHGTPELAATEPPHG